MASHSYAAHEILVAPARPRASVPRLIVGFLLALLVAYGLNAGLQAGLRAAVPRFWATEIAGRGAPGSSPAALLVLLGSFGFVTIGALVAAAVVYGRDPLGVIGPLRPALHQFWRVLRALAVLGAALLLLPPYGFGDPLVPNLPAGLWLRLLPLSLVAVLIQVSAEEILFRGFLQQGLAARFSSPLIWAGIPSLMFAAGHFAPSEAGDNAWVVMLWAGFFGLLMADLTARAGTLGPAIAVHFFNNVSSLLFISVPDSLNGLALYNLPYSMSDTEALRLWLPVDFAIMLIGWLLARVVLRR